MSGGFHSSLKFSLKFDNVLKYFFTRKDFVPVLVSFFLFHACNELEKCPLLITSGYEIANTHLYTPTHSHTHTSTLYFVRSFLYTMPVMRGNAVGSQQNTHFPYTFIQIHTRLHWHTSTLLSVLCYPQTLRHMQIRAPPEGDIAVGHGAVKKMNNVSQQKCCWGSLCDC